MWKFQNGGRYAITFTLIGVLFSFIFDVRDNHTLRRGQLYRYTVMAFPQPQNNNGAIRPRILYARMIIRLIHIIINFKLYKDEY